MRSTAEDSLRIAILGAGAMGSLFGGRLNESGATVTLLDVNEAHLEAISQRGLRLVTDTGCRTIRLPVAKPAEARDPPDLIIVFTKTMHTRAVLGSAKAMIGPETHVLSLQNGLGNREILAEFVPEDRILIGVTTYPADLRGPGHVESHGDGTVRLMTADGRTRPILDRIAGAFQAAGLHCVADPTVVAAIWEKVSFNAALNSVCAVTGSTVGEVGASSDGRSLALAIVDEVMTVAEVQDIPVDRARVHAAVVHALDTHLTHKPSLLQDVLASRPTEIDAINGAIVAAAWKHDVPVPHTSTLLSLMRIIEGKHRNM
jgi:2-dehydropantoate 2-reductase